MQTTKDGLTMTGQIKVNAKGNGFMRIPDSKEELYIPNMYMNTAFNGDEVAVQILDSMFQEKKEAKVLEIISRAKDNFVGVLAVDPKNSQQFIVMPDDRRTYTFFSVIPLPEELEVLQKSIGQKVLIAMKEWKDTKMYPPARLIKVIGVKGDNNVEMESIVLDQGFDIDFAHSIENEARQIAQKEIPIPVDEIEKRKANGGDFRDTLTCTIDPEDAKDFDDALSLKKLPSEGGEELYEVGVHIADVSHYVIRGTAIDDEAQKRAFSVYLVDRTIPMLPEILSNDLCSLNPHTDKLAFSAVFVMDTKGHVHKRWFGKTIINSNKRFSYEEAQGVITSGQGPLAEELKTLNTLAKILKEQKTAKGAIDFETDEVKFRLDKDGKPLEIYKKHRLDAHKLVEEFMLLANREVAEYIFKANKDKKFGNVYRIHDVPNPDKIAELALLLKAVGIAFDSKKERLSPKDIQAVLKQAEGHSSENLIKVSTIRSMAKAIYDVKNIGHFGLAFEYYTHFTSPIRRYPDLMVHRIISHIIDGQTIDGVEQAFLKHMCEKSTEREIEAAEAERNSIKYKQAEYIQNHIGEVFDGVISGVAEWGIFIELPDTKIEGMIHVKNLGNDFYSCDKKTMSVVGQKTGARFTLGDKVKVRVKAADIERKTIDFEMVK